MVSEMVLSHPLLLSCRQPCSINPLVCFSLSNWEENSRNEQFRKSIKPLGKSIKSLGKSIKSLILTFGKQVHGAVAFGTGRAAKDGEEKSAEKLISVRVMRAGLSIRDPGVAPSQ